MIKTQITQNQINNAKRKSDDLGKLNNSIREGRGNFIGFLGEELVKSTLNIQDNNSYDFDLIYNNLKLEIKTKERTVIPRPFYNATVAAYNTRQECDYYVFVSILNNLEYGWICGYLPKKEFYNKATFNRKGEPETPYFNFKADCYNVKYSDLLEFDFMFKNDQITKKCF